MPRPSLKNSPERAPHGAGGPPGEAPAGGAAALPRLAGLAALALLAWLGRDLLPLLILLTALVSLEGGLRLGPKAGLLAGLAAAAVHLLTYRAWGGAEGLGPVVPALGALGLVLTGASCGWFGGRKRRARTRAELAEGHLRSAGRELEDARRRLEVARRLQETQAAFLAEVGRRMHEPLLGICGRLAEAASTRDGARREALLRETLERAVSQQALVGGVLRLQELQSGGWHPRFAPVNPRDLADRAVESSAHAARDRGVELVHLPPSDKEIPIIHADGEKVAEVLGTMVLNAVHSSPPGGIVRVGEELCLDEDLERLFPHLIFSTQAVRFSVTDSGQGMPDAVRAHLFDMLGPAGQSRTWEPSALRLAIAREVVRLHWGRIWAEGTPGGGNTFCFTLPVNPARIRRKVALVKRPLNLETLLESLLLQFDEEMLRKGLKVARRGWPSPDGKGITVEADRQLMLGVLFNILSNKVRYAAPGGELEILMERGPGGVRLRLTDLGERMDALTLERLATGASPVEGENAEDLRRVNVNLSLARDIVESHGGTFTLDDLGGRGLSITLTLP